MRLTRRRKTILSTLAIVLIAALYGASPYLTAYRLRSAVEHGDWQAVVERIDLRALRDSMKQQILSSGDSDSLTLGQLIEVNAVDLLITKDRLPDALSKQSEQGVANFDDVTLEWASLGMMLIEYNDAGLYMEFQLLRGWRIVAVSGGALQVSM